jgi:small subunit ribosomal protein S18
MRRSRSRSSRGPSRRHRGDRCRFCRDDVETVNYKDLEKLQRLMSSEAALFSKKRSGNCSRHQRMVKRAVKRARSLALLPYL